MVATYVLAAGESLNRPDESRLSSVRFLLSPLVWLRQPGVQLRCPLPRGIGWALAGWQAKGCGDKADSLVFS